VRDEAYWVGQLRYIGCTGHAHEVAVMFGDEFEERARALRYDAAKPVEVLRDALAHGMPDRHSTRGAAALFAMRKDLLGRAAHRPTRASIRARRKGIRHGA
jgi:hypothetical protein